MADNKNAVETVEPKAKKEKVKLQETFDTADAAVKAATERTKGPRRAFKVTFNGADHYVVHNNEGRAAGVVGLKLGMQVEELGRVRKAKAIGQDTILAALQALPEDQRSKIMEQLKAAPAAQPKASGGEKPAAAKK